jgi:hypothetical protein
MTKKNEPNVIENYINSLGQGWCIKYVLIAIVEDEESDQSFCVQCPDNQTAAETIGMCEAVSFVQKAKIADTWITQQMLEEFDDDE